MAIPPRGTRFNYFIRSGIGIVWRAPNGLQLLGGVRWVHISNYGLAGRDRNPDIQALGISAGLVMDLDN